MNRVLVREAYQRFPDGDGTCRDSYGVTLEGRKGEVTKEVQEWLRDHADEDKCPF